MKSTKLPQPEEVKKLLAEAAQIARLDDDYSTLCRQLGEDQRECRKRIFVHIGEPFDPNVSLEAALVKSRRQQVGDSEIGQLLAKIAEGTAKANENRKAKTEAFRPLRARVNQLAESLIASKQAEYDALIQEIAAKLSPYCDGNKEQAVWLAQQTAAATANYSAFSACNPILFPADNLISPLRAILQLIAA